VLRAALVALAVGFFVAAIATEWSKLGRVEWRFAPVPLVLAFVAFAVFQQMHAELWRRLLAGLGHPLPARRAWAIWNVSLLGRYVPTSVLMATGRMALAEREGVPRRVTVLSVLYEVALSLTGASFLIAAFLLAVPGVAGWLRAAGVLLPLCGLAAVQPRLFHLVADLALRRLRLEPLPVRLRAGPAVALVAGYAISFVIAGLGTLAVLGAVTPVGGGDDVVVAVGAYAVGYWASILGFLLPAGLGVREAGLAGALATVAPLGVSTVASVLVRLVQLAIEAAYALLSPLLSRGVVSLSAARKASASASDSGVPIS
jgi:hypothetical protein